jgi:hypothetical protein
MMLYAGYVVALCGFQRKPWAERPSVCILLCAITATKLPPLLISPR